MGRATNWQQHWQCGGIMHDMLMKLKKGSWCVPLSKDQHPHLYVALTQSFQPDFLALRAQSRAVPLLCVGGCAGDLQLAWSAQPRAVPLLCARVVYQAQPALPRSALIFFASGLFGARLQSSSSPFLSLKTQSVSYTQQIHRRLVTRWRVLCRIQQTHRR